MKLFTSHALLARGTQVLFALVVLGLGPKGYGQEIRLESVGARFGLYPFGAGHDFHQGEAFVNWDLPWKWDLGSSWDLKSRVEVSAGWIGESDAEGFIAGAGPNLMLRHGGLPLSLEAGVSPTVMTRTDFRSKDFGIPFQFTSHIGLNLDISSHFRFGYRFQHMSNSGLSRHNPGLNLHMLGVSYLF